MFERFVGGFKVRAACEEMAMQPRTASLLVHVYNFTRGGEKKDALELKSGQTLRGALGPLALGFMGEQAGDLRRLFLEPEFREETLQLYQQIKPRVDAMSFGDMIKVLLRR